MLEIRVNKNIVSVQETEPLISGSASVYKCRFSFDALWDGFFRSAVFRVGSMVKTIPLDGTDTCELPWELLDKKHICLPVEVSVYGVKGETEILPTTWDKLGRVRRGSEPGEEAKEFSPSVYDRIVSLVKLYSDKSKGDKGDKGDPGEGDMTAAVYDPQGRKTDIYQYADDVLSAVPAWAMQPEKPAYTASEVGAAPAPLSNSKTLYVATTGNDTTGDGTQANPYATIQHALDTVPKNLGGCLLTISVAAGTYDRIYVSGFYNGILAIQGESNSTVHIGNSSYGAYIGYCNAEIRISSLHLVGNQWNYGLNIADSSFAYVNGVVIDGTTSVGGIRVQRSSVVAMYGVTISDKTTGAVRIDGATALVNRLQGSNNTVGIMSGDANGLAIPSIMVCSNVTMTASSLYSKAAGGIIIKDGAFV